VEPSRPEGRGSPVKKLPIFLRASLGPALKAVLAESIPVAANLDNLHRFPYKHFVSNFPYPTPRKEVPMHFENMEAILNFAMEKEKEAVDFYRSLSEKESLSGSREMFADFAKEEQKHFDMLSNVKSGAPDKAVTGYKFKWIPDIKRSDYVVETAYQEGMGYNEILMLAMKREEKALALYNTLLKQAETEAAKKIFKILCQEEAKHKLALETLYDDYMAKMGD